MIQKADAGITLEGKTYSNSEILSYCNEQLDYASLPDWKRSVLEFLIKWYSGDNYIELKTSGSTGSPKVISAPKSALWASAESTCNYFNFKKGENLLLCLPANQIAGIMIIIRAIVAQMNLCLEKPSSIPLSSLKSDSQIRMVSLVPMQLQNLITEKATDGLKRLKQVDSVLLGGSPITPDLFFELKDMQADVYASYGMTETYSHIAIAKLPQRSTIQYSCMPGVYVRLDERSCLVIDAPHIGIQRLVTNDIAEIHDNGTFSIKGRWDNVINSGGIKISPEEVESVIQHLIPKQSFIVFPMADHHLGEKVCLLIEGKEWADTEIQNLKRAFTSVLSKYQIPKKIVFLESFSRTSSGKINRPESIRSLCNTF